MKTTLYVCLMHENETAASPGECDECGAPLEPAEFVWSKLADEWMREKDADLVAANEQATRWIGKAYDLGKEVARLRLKDESASFINLRHLTAIQERDAEIERLTALVDEWQSCGENIMQAVTGKPAQLSDSDVIGALAAKDAEIERLRDALDEYVALFSDCECEHKNRGHGAQNDYCLDCGYFPLEGGPK